MRGKQSLVKLGFFKNPFSLAAFGAGVALLCCVIFIPGLQSLFNVVVFAPVNLLVILCCSLAPTVVIQVFRMIKEAVKK